MEYADRILNSRFCSHTLDGLNDNLLGLLVGIELCLVHNFIDIAGSCSLGLILHRLHQTVLGFLSTQTRYFLEQFALFQLHFLEFLSLYAQQLLLVLKTILLIVEFVLTTAQLILTLVQRNLTLLEFVLTLLDVLITLLHFLLQLALLVKELLLHFEQLLFLDDFSLLFGSIDHLLVFSFQNIAENKISADSS